MSSASTVTVQLSDIGITAKSCRTRDLWERKDAGSSGSALAVRIPGSAAHYFGALYALTQCQWGDAMVMWSSGDSSGFTNKPKNYLFYNNIVQERCAKYKCCLFHCYLYLSDRLSHRGLNVFSDQKSLWLAITHARACTRCCVYLIEHHK